MLIPALCTQVNAVLFLHLMILLQLSIVLARNPSFWCRFTKSTAPVPSPWLAVPMAVFLLGATFVAVYWPINVQPDGGRGELQGAGGLHVWLHAGCRLFAADDAWCLIQTKFGRLAEHALSLTFV